MNKFSMQPTYNPTYIIGDIHGRFCDLLDLIDKHKLINCTLICVGDLGIGFGLNDIENINFLNKYFADRGIHFMSVRGNHDDPSYFNGDISHSNFELLGDYSWKIINNEKFLFVGGAISIDRKRRILNKSYWLDEVFILSEELCAPCDVLITHSAPRWIGPHDKSNIDGFCKLDDRLWDDCVKEREDIGRLVDLTLPNKAYAGHFHKYYNEIVAGTEFTILAELQIKEHIHTTKP